MSTHKKQTGGLLLFLRAHASLLIIIAAMLSTIAAVYWLGARRSEAVAGYAVLLGVFWISVYLFIHYQRNKKFYARLASAPDSLDQMLEKLDHAPMSQALEQLLQSQYRMMHQQLVAWEQQKNTHQTFINQWVHQMKTPLSVIDLTLQEQSASPYTASIREETDRLRAGLDTVLYAARLDSFEHDFQIKLVSLASAVHNAVHECKRLFIRSLVYPSVAEGPELFVRTDEKWLSFMIIQLLTNAIKYSAGEHKKVEIRTYTHGGQAVLEIKDAGIGIPSTDIRRVFDPFFTGVNGRHYRESTGMGLYLVKQACDRLQHEVEIESNTGEGTTVRLRFPSWEERNLTSM